MDFVTAGEAKRYNKHQKVRIRWTIASRFSLRFVTFRYPLMTFRYAPLRPDETKHSRIAHKNASKARYLS